MRRCDNRFFLKTCDASVLIRLDGAETAHIRTLRHVFGHNRNIGTFLDMIIQYFVIIQLVDRIA